MDKILKKNCIVKIGRRKTAVAVVKFVKKGTGKMTVNGKELAKYFSYLEYRNLSLKPLRVLNMVDSVDCQIKVSGGGVHSHAEAISLALSRCLVEMDEANKKTLKKLGLLSRDSRKKERKKPGLRRARRAPQWSKR